MNEIENRRSIRKYRKEMPDRGMIDEILHAGMLAPSAKNRQPWKFLVYTEKSKEMLLSAMETGLIRMRDDSTVPQAAKAGLTDAFHTLGIMREAPVLVAVLNTGSGSPFAEISPADRITEICDSLSIGAAVENMLLKATALGLGSLWIANTFFAYPELTAVIGTDAQLACAVVFGYADEAPPQRPRKPFGDAAEYRWPDGSNEMHAREFLEILHIAERLKDTPRHCTTANRRTESVAEHCWRVSLMAMLLRPDFPEADTDKVIRMCLIHDLGECFTGDIPTFLKTDADRRTEDSLLRQWVRSLPPETAAELSALYDELDAQVTAEAKLCKAIDKLEALIQHNESPLDTWSENEFELNKTYAFDTVAFSEKLMVLRKEILADTMKKINDE